MIVEVSAGAVQERSISYGEAAPAIRFLGAEEDTVDEATVNGDDDRGDVELDVGAKDGVEEDCSEEVAVLVPKTVPDGVDVVVEVAL